MVKVCYFLLKYRVDLRIAANILLLQVENNE